MDYYRKFPGDYLRDTRHLTLTEHGAYNLLLDHLYTSESAIPNVAFAVKVCGAMTKREQNAVKSVLAKFFKLHEEGYRHKRVDEELIYAESKRNKAKQSAEARWHKDANALPTHSDRNAIPDNQTTRQPEETNTKVSEFENFWQIYPKQIKKERAKYAWIKAGCESRAIEIMASLIDWNQTWTDPQYIPDASRWIGEGMWKENPHVAKRREAGKNEHKQQRNQEVIERVRRRINPRLGESIGSELLDGLKRVAGGSLHTGTEEKLKTPN